MLRPITRKASEADRPMRWPAAQRLARSFTTKVIGKWDDFEAKLIRWLPGKVSVEAAREKQAGFLPRVAKYVHGGDCGCGSCAGPHTLPNNGNSAKTLLDMVEKAWTDSDIRKLRTEMAQHFSAIEIHEFEKMFDDVLAEYMVGSGSVETEGALFNEFYVEAFGVGGKQAYLDAKQAVQRADKKTRTWFQKFVPEVVQLNPSALYIQQTFKTGFKLISANITKKFKGEAMKAITQGLADGKDWLTIARNIHNTVGAGARWQWKRLVRTELAGVFDKESKNRYKDMRVPYVRFSMVPGACSICQDIKNRNGGYYKLSGAPGIPENTHPHCRCRWLPVYNLPRGVRAAA